MGSDYTEDKVNKLIEDADFNKDGQISFQEFLNAVRLKNERLFEEVVELEVDSDRSELLTVTATIPGGKNDKPSEENS